MIAGTYTPFTTCRLYGAWALGLTATVWIGAVLGAVIKLVHLPRLERLSIVAYLGLGWMILVGLRPLLAAVDATSVVLIAVGGALYFDWDGFPCVALVTFAQCNMARLRDG